MNKLLNANFSRLWKNKYFWFCTGAMFVYIVLYVVDGGKIVSESGSSQKWNLEDYYFQFSLVIGLFSAVFSTLFLGQEYSDGAVRNKIIAGHSRRDIYFSDIIVTFTASLVMLLAGCLGGLAGIPAFGLWEMGGGEIFLYLLITAAFILVFCAIYTSINVLTQNKALGAVLTILLFFALLLVTAKLEEGLNASETIFDGVIISGTEVSYANPRPNPRYVSGVKREVFDFLVDILPTGQGERVAFLKVGHPVRMLLSSMVLTVLVAIGGMFAFERKDLK